MAVSLVSLLGLLAVLAAFVVAPLALLGLGLLALLLARPGAARGPSAPHSRTRATRHHGFGAGVG